MIVELQDRATRKLRGLRGQLDLHDGITPYGAKTARACMLPPIVVQERLRWTKSRPIKPRRPRRGAGVVSDSVATTQVSVPIEAARPAGEVS